LKASRIALSISQEEKLDGFEKSLVYGKTLTKRLLISITYKLGLLIFGLFARPSSLMASQKG
jgi:hypothetical protein